MYSENVSNYIFEEYKGYTIASNRKNVAKKNSKNIIIVYRTEDFPKGGIIIGMDKSDQSNHKKRSPHNMDDAKKYIDFAVESHQKKGASRTEKEMPTVIIEGTNFLFDIDRLILFEKENAANHIYFSSMRDCGSHYEFDYSRVSKNFHALHNPYTHHKQVISGNRTSAQQGDPLIEVKIPSIGEIDPDGMCRKYRCTLREVRKKTDFEIMVDQDVFGKRQNGIPVTIDFPGKRFEIDVANNLLRPQDGNGDNIYLNAMYDYFLIDPRYYFIFYNTETRKVENPFKDGSLDKHKDRVVVVIPSLSEVDPIGANRIYGQYPSNGLMYRRLTMNYNPQIIPSEVYCHIIKNQNHPAFQKPNGSISKREFPTVNIEGTEFIVDVNKIELRQKDYPDNTISFFDMEDVGDGYKFEYSLKHKNLPELWDNNRISIKLPELVVLDPTGIAQKYGLTVDQVMDKTDFDLMVDQYAFYVRVNEGRLPTIDIAGHHFYVDVRMDMLRPKDDFLSNGIVFDKIDDYYSEKLNGYIIPYNSKTHEFQEPDYASITKFPKDLIAVQFPSSKELDPIGWNRQFGGDIKDNLKHIGIKQHFMAKIIPWQETYLPAIISNNLEQQQQKKKNTIPKKAAQNKTTKGKGPQL